MEKRVIFLSGMALLFLLTVLTSCSDDEGYEGAPMEWAGGIANTTSSTIHHYDFEVPAGGGDYMFECTNYNRVWVQSIADIKGDNILTDSTDTFLFPQNDSVRVEYDKTGTGYIASNWAEADMRDNKLLVSIQPNTTGKDRTILVSTSAGNIGTDFYFFQSK